MERPYLYYDSNKLAYFAYGSNMDLDQMRIRCNSGYDVLGTVELSGWKFFINQRGYASIAQEEGALVHGVLFNLSHRCLLTLDTYEGYPQFYTREKLGIKFKEEIKNPWVYIDKNSLQIGSPRSGYLEKIITSAKSFNFPQGYINYLESFLALRS